MKWNALSRRVLDGDSLKRNDALAVLESDDNELLAVLDAAFTVRRYYFGRDVSLHVIRNAKSGSCSENCSFCSQSALSESDIHRNPWYWAKRFFEGADT